MAAPGRRRGGREFVAVRRGQRGLRLHLHLHLHLHLYDSVLVSADNVDEVLAELR